MLITIKPNPDFLNNVIAFSIGIVAFAVPIAFNIAIRISERYKNSLIANEYIKFSYIRILIYYSMGVIFIAVLVNYYSYYITPEVSNLSCWNYLALAVLSLFVVECVLFMTTLYKFTKYIINEDKFNEVFLRRLNVLIDTKSKTRVLELLNGAAKIFAYYKGKDVAKLDIKFHIIVTINQYLTETSQKPNNSDYLKDIFDILNEMNDVAIKKDDPLLVHTSSSWYFDSVFGMFDNKFDLSYLDFFNRRFYKIMRLLIKEDKLDVFKAVVHRLHDGILEPYITRKIEDYYNLADDNEFQNHETKDYYLKSIELEEKASEIIEKEDLDKWNTKYEEFKTFITSKINITDKDRAYELDKEILEYAQFQVKYHALKKTLVEICVYCLFKEKLNYILELWNFKQPSRSNATWCGEDVLPHSEMGLINLYLSKKRKKEFMFWEGHLQSEDFYEELFLVFFMLVLQRNDIDKNINSFHLNKLEVVDDLNILLSSVSKFKKNIDILERRSDSFFEQLGIKSNEKGLLIVELKDLLEKIEIQAEKQREEEEIKQPVSQSKIHEFQKNFIAQYNEKRKLKDIFKWHKLYIDKIKENYTGTVNLFTAVKQIVEKAVFFDKWHIHYTGLDNSLATSFALGLNADIFSELEKKCIQEEKDNLDNLLDGLLKIDSNWIILLENSHQSILHKDDNKYIPKELSPNPELDKRNIFTGYYTVQDKKMPVFRVFGHSQNKRIFVLNKDKLGHFIQYSPLSLNDEPEDRMNEFLIRIREFATNEDLIEEVLTSPTPNLKNQGGAEAQRKYLKQHVLLEIYERFEFVPHPDFVGYVIDL